MNIWKSISRSAVNRPFCFLILVPDGDLDFRSRYMLDLLLHTILEYWICRPFLALSNHNSKISWIFLSIITSLQTVLRECYILSFPEIHQTQLFRIIRSPFSYDLRTSLPLVSLIEPIQLQPDSDLAFQSPRTVRETLMPVVWVVTALQGDQQSPVTGISGMNFHSNVPFPTVNMYVKGAL